MRVYSCPPMAGSVPFPDGGFSFLEGVRFPEEIVARGDVSPAGLEFEMDLRGVGVERVVSQSA